MKIVVIGGTGLIGSKLVKELSDAGHVACPASPDTGVNTITGEGLAEAIEGAHVVADVANAPAWDDAAVMEAFGYRVTVVPGAETNIKVTTMDDLARLTEASESARAAVPIEANQDRTRVAKVG